MGACVIECGPQVLLYQGGGFRNRDSEGRPGSYFRTFLSGGQVPFPGDWRNGSRTGHCKKCGDHTPGLHQGIQQSRRGDYIYGPGAYDLCIGPGLIDISDKGEQDEK